MREVETSRSALTNGGGGDLAYALTRKDSPRDRSPGDGVLPRTTRTARDLFAALTTSDGLLAAPLPPPAIRGGK